MKGKTKSKDMFTILYEVRGLQYIIGVTDEKVPVIAALGVNTSRPLPQNIRKAIIETVMEIKQLKDEPRLIDYNAPSQMFSRTVLGDFTKSPMESVNQPARTIEETLAELKLKMNKEEIK